MKSFLASSILFFSLCMSFAFQTDRVSKLDSILSLRLLSNNNEIDIQDRFEFADLACKLSDEYAIDTTRLKSYRNLSSLYLYYDEDEQFGKINKQILSLAKKMKDTLHIAYTYQNLGYYFETRNESDSAYYFYYNAEKTYESIGEIRNRGETLSSMTNIQETEKDYVGSEINAIKAIKLLSTLEMNERNTKKLCDLYNLLAILSHRMKNYDDAIAYYNKAIETSEGTSHYLYYSLNCKNNIGFSYFEQGKYNKALDLFNEVANYENFLDLDPTLYATVNGNIAHTKYKLGQNKNEIEKIFLDAFKLSDSINDQYGIISVGNYFADFYFQEGNIKDALKIAKRTLKAAKEINASNEILNSLEILSKLEKGEAGKKYLYEHIKLSDSLLDKERAYRNKFAKIEFETDQIIAEKEQLSKERLIFLISSIGLLILLFLLYIIISQRSKNKELEFSQKQQEANEEIYNLMLAQQDKIEEGRTQEKKRISEELHDGILGRLFGTRLSLDSLNLVKTDEAIKSRSQYINELKTIEQEIRKISHDLNVDFVAGSGFMDIVKTLVENQTQAYELDYSLESDENINWDLISNKTKIHIYRMLQETMQNIYKHANASEVKIGFKLKNNVILMTVEDDGEGFNINKARKGIGIKNINSRVKEINGKVDIESAINKGTLITISVPI